MCGGAALPMASPMDMPQTLALTAASGALTAFAAWRSARPTTFGKVRLIPWTWIMLGGAVATVVLLVHVFNLMGVETGRRY